MSKTQGLIERAWSDPVARRFCVLMGLVGFSIENARVVRDTYFVSTAGADHIPIAYVIFAVVMVGASALYAKLSARVPIARLASLILMISCIAAGTQWLLIREGRVDITLAYVVFCTAEMFFLFVPMTVWAVANQNFEVEKGEFYLPGVSSVGLLGAVIGALSVRLMIEVTGPYEPFAMAAIGFLLAWKLSLKLSSEPPEAASGEAAACAMPEREDGIWGEAIVRTLVCLAGPMWVLAYMIEYTYYATVAVAFPSAEELSKFLSLYGAICSVVALVIQLFFMPWMVRRFGVATTVFTYPVCLALGAVSTLVFSLFPTDSIAPWTMSTPLLLVLTARMLDISIYQSLYDSTVHALYYGVPEKTRTLARAVVSGMIFPASIAGAGLLLWGLKYMNEPIHHITFSAVAVGFLVIVIAMDIKPDYLRSLLRHTDARNIALRTRLLGEIGRLSLAESRNIMLESLSSSSPSEALFAARSLAERYDHTLVEDLVERAPIMSAEVRAELLESLSGEAPEELRVALGGSA